ncbi:hypothetical protein AVEN_96122-1 [Araneus ventricosus]|uniref:Uncharacterized protein n=1 Tax=Araneus ventricosus TaxID=182803 RepID=A0A4Y2A6M3_ARAVE|nr:hypothetical protein AVEN_96122-1 [Araneus ventricosus]
MLQLSKNIEYVSYRQERNRANLAIQRSKKIRQDKKVPNALHKLVLERLQLSAFASQALGSILALALGIGYAVSTEVRCVCCLTIPSLCGKAGRMYLSTFIITFIILGPIANITSNARESMRVMSCISSLNLNHTVERFKLMFKPVKEIVWDFVGASEKVQKNTKGIEGAYKQIDNEV